MLKGLIFTLWVATMGSLTSAQVVPQMVGWSTGYYAGWVQAKGKLPPSAIQWKGFTHMCHFSITPYADGTINTGAMGLKDQYFKDFVAEAHKAKVKAIISVGGAGTGVQFQSATANATIRAKFIDGLLSFMKKYGYDGIDMDWEELGGKDSQYVALHKEMRQAMDKLTPRPIFTSAIASYVAKACGSVHPYMDQMNNMCYWTKAADLTNDFKALVDAGVPKEKMGVGMGWDYSEAPNPEIDCDPVATKAKIMYALNNGYGGVMVWGIEMDGERNGGKWPITDTLSHYVPLDVPTYFRNAARKENPRLLSIWKQQTGGQRLIFYSVDGTETPFHSGAYIIKMTSETNFQIDFSKEFGEPR